MIKVRKGIILATLLDQENELGGVIVPVRTDTVDAKVVAAGADIDDIFEGDIITTPKGRKLFSINDGEEIYAFEYGQILFWKPKN